MVAKQHKRNMLENLVVTTVGSRGDEKAVKDLTKQLDGNKANHQMVEQVPSKYITNDFTGIPTEIMEDNKE